MTGTRIDVNTLSDMERINGEGSDRSFWNVLIESSSRSELVEALHSQYCGLERDVLSEQEDVDQFPDFDTSRNHILDYRGKEALHIPSLGHASYDPLHSFQPLPLHPRLQQLRYLLDLVI